MSFSPMKSATAFQQQQEAQHNISWVPPHQCQRRKIVSSNNYKVVINNECDATMSVGHHNAQLHTNSLTNSSYVQYFPLELNNLDYIRKSIDICCYTVMAVCNYHNNAIRDEFDKKSWESKYVCITENKELMNMLNELSSFSMVGVLSGNNEEKNRLLWCGKDKVELLTEHVVAILKDIDQVRHYMIHGLFKSNTEPKPETTTTQNTPCECALNFRCMDSSSKLSPMTLFFDDVYGFLHCFDPPKAESDVIMSLDVLDNCLDLYKKDVLSLQMQLRQHIAYQQQRVTTLGWKWDEIDQVSGTLLTEGFNNTSDTVENENPNKDQTHLEQSMRRSDMDSSNLNVHKQTGNSKNMKPDELLIELSRLLKHMKLYATSKVSTCNTSMEIAYTMLLFRMYSVCTTDLAHYIHYNATETYNYEESNRLQALSNAIMDTIDTSLTIDAIEVPEYTDPDEPVLVYGAHRVQMILELVLKAKNLLLNLAAAEIEAKSNGDYTLANKLINSTRELTLFKNNLEEYTTPFSFQKDPKVKSLIAAGERKQEVMASDGSTSANVEHSVNSNNNIVTIASTSFINSDFIFKYIYKSDGHSIAGLIIKSCAKRVLQHIQLTWPEISVFNDASKRVKPIQDNTNSCYRFDVGATATSKNISEMNGNAVTVGLGKVDIATGKMGKTTEKFIEEKIRFEDVGTSHASHQMHTQNVEKPPWGSQGGRLIKNNSSPYTSMNDTSSHDFEQSLTASFRRTMSSAGLNNTVDSSTTNQTKMRNISLYSRPTIVTELKNAQLVSVPIQSSQSLRLRSVSPSATTTPGVTTATMGRNVTEIINPHCDGTSVDKEKLLYDWNNSNSMTEASLRYNANALRVMENNGLHVPSVTTTRTPANNVASNDHALKHSVQVSNSYLGIPKSNYSSERPWIHSYYQIPLEERVAHPDAYARISPGASHSQTPSRSRSQSPNPYAQGTSHLNRSAPHSPGDLINAGLSGGNLNMADFSNNSNGDHWQDIDNRSVISAVSSRSASPSINSRRSNRKGKVPFSSNSRRFVRDDESVRSLQSAHSLRSTSTRGYVDAVSGQYINRSSMQHDSIPVILHPDVIINNLKANDPFYATMDKYCSPIAIAHTRLINRLLGFYNDILNLRDIYTRIDASECERLGYLSNVMQGAIDADTPVAGLGTGMGAGGTDHLLSNASMYEHHPDENREYGRSRLDYIRELCEDGTRRVHDFLSEAKACQSRRDFTTAKQLKNTAHDYKLLIDTLQESIAPTSILYLNNHSTQLLHMFQQQPESISMIQSNYIFEYSNNSIYGDHYNIAALAILCKNHSILTYIRTYWPDFTVLSPIGDAPDKTDEHHVDAHVAFSDIVELRELGFNIPTLKSAGFSDSDILGAGFSINELRTNGFNATDLRSTTNLSNHTIKVLGLNSNGPANHSAEEEPEKFKKTGTAVVELETLLDFYCNATNGMQSDQIRAGSGSRTPNRGGPSDPNNKGWVNNTNWNKLRERFTSLNSGDVADGVMGSSVNVAELLGNHNTYNGLISNNKLVNTDPDSIYPYGVRFEEVVIEDHQDGEWGYDYVRDDEEMDENGGSVAGGIHLNHTVTSSMVTRISLANNNIVGFLPDTLANLHGLQQLILNNNRISGQIPMSFGALMHMTTLFLHFNRLVGPIPTSICNGCKQLLILRLDNNQLTGTIPESIGKLKYLKRLVLNNNQLSGSIPASIGQLTSLHEIILHHNQLSGSIPPNISQAVSLTTCLLNHNKLSGNIPESICNLKHLTALHLHNNGTFFVDKLILQRWLPKCHVKLV